MKNRFKQIRLHSDINLSQEAFGKRLGVTGAAISRIESGNREPSDLLIGAVCREFNVNEKWLRTGAGEMFVKQTREDEIAAFFDDALLGEPDFRKRFISALTRMTPEEWTILEKMALGLAGEVQEAARKKEAKELGQKAAQLTEAESLSEQEPDTQASSVKESGAV